MEISDFKLINKDEPFPDGKKLYATIKVTRGFWPFKHTRNEIIFTNIEEDINGTEYVSPQWFFFKDNKLTPNIVHFLYRDHVRKTVRKRKFN